MFKVKKKAMQQPETYSEHFQISKMEHFAITDNGF